MSLTNPHLARPALRFALYALSGLMLLTGTILLGTTLTAIPEREDLTAITGTVRKADPVIIPMPLSYPHTRRPTPQLAVRLELVNDSGTAIALDVPEPQITMKDAPLLVGHTATALIEGPSAIWELTTPDQTFVSYEETRATQTEGRTLSLTLGPLLLVLALALLKRLRAKPTA